MGLLSMGEGGVGELKLGFGNVVVVGEGILQDPSEHLFAVVLWWCRRRIPNPNTRPTTTSTVTMKMKIFVAFPT